MPKRRTIRARLIRTRGHAPLVNDDPCVELQAEVARLRAALRPFAKEWADGGWGTDSDDEYPLIRGEDDDAGSEEHAHFSAGDLRRAYEAYGGDDALEGAANEAR